jgi:hypothetical protein
MLIIADLRPAISGAVKPKPDHLTGIYEFTCSREHEHAFKLFKDYDGDIMADDYGAYQSLKESAQYKCRLHCCWAHVRRKFTETMNGNLILRDKLLLYLTRL